MKAKTTKKSVNSKYDNVIQVGYCNLQYLLNYANPIAYTSTKAYGWRADIYEVKDVAIATGYAPFGNIEPSYDTLYKYDNLAQKIVLDNSKTWEEREELVNKLLNQFINEVLQ